MLVFTVKRTDTGEVLKRTELGWIANDSRRIVGPHWNNYVAYQVKKTGVCTIIGDHVTYEYKLEGKDAITN